VYNAIRQFDTSGGANLWARIAEGRPPQLLDYPDHRSSALPTLAAAKAYSGTHGDGGDTLMIFGDFREAFLIVDRIGMTVEMVPLVMGANRRPIGNRGVYAVWMNNSKVIVPGALKRLVNKQA
jgi:HK97 family phage major capsid protein